MKQYIFTDEEQIILRDALIEYKHFIKPPITGASASRHEIYASTAALADQFRNDVRLSHNQ